jgi:hypothetical protein
VQLTLPRPEKESDVSAFRGVSTRHLAGLVSAGYCELQEWPTSSADARAIGAAQAGSGELPLYSTVVSHLHHFAGLLGNSNRLVKRRFGGFWSLEAGNAHQLIYSLCSCCSTQPACSDCRMARPPRLDSVHLLLLARTWMELRLGIEGEILQN